MKRLLKEPFLHFLALGVMIFGVDAWRDRGKPAPADFDGKRIEVNAATITRLKDGWTRQFQGAPTADDLRDMVEQRIREEVLSREALALGLDRDDTIVRRRLAQKMEFLTQDITTAPVPDEATLATYFAGNLDRYAEPVRVSFRHVYFSKERRGANLEADASAALAGLAKPDANEEAFGDPFLQGYEFSDQNEQDLAGVFGREFGLAVMKAPTDAWSGPIASSYGTHLVYVTKRAASQPVELASVRETVLRDYLEERRQAGNVEVLARMKENYDVVIDEAALEAAAADQDRTASTGP